MNSYPDFSDYGYRIERELGANRSGGRVTYLATDIDLDCQVVLKQFQFAQASSSWSAYDAHQREIQVLKDLQHPGIPRYLNSFQMADGFCMVQDYKAAQPLSISRSFSAEEIQTVATQILKILIYLQNRLPPIIHRDLKPDNILVDNNLEVFLVDFGFARVGDGEVGVSSVVKGTLGFMPPEQLFNRQLTEASDLYGLGMTLICLLTNTKADDIGDLVDISYNVKFKHLVPKLSIHWVKWLEKMTEPRVKDRFSNAQEALKALPTSSILPPEVRLSSSEVELQAVRTDELLTHSLEVINAIPETILSGSWKVQKHPNDPVQLNNQHPWIQVNPETFEGERIACRIEVDTSKLMAGTGYQRTLILQTNAFPQTYTIPLNVRTAAVPIRSAQVSLYPLLLLSIGVLLTTRAIFGMVLSPENLSFESTGVTGLGLSIGTIIGLQGAALTLQQAGSVVGSQSITLATTCFGVPTLVSIWFLLENLSGSLDTILAGFIPGIFGGWLLGLGMGMAIEKLLKDQIPKPRAITLALLTSFLAIILALGLTIGFSQPFLLLAITMLSIVLCSLLLNAPLNYAKRIANYRKLEGKRIRP
ncbi:MAG: serine/threonine protein kinase [Leptolyngbya sp. SIO1D8]|nr:serine/threonine protein kinase [Leptolyngbya sp. SIO1D8]